jgi:Protein of unknown function (DUF4054)
VDVGTFQASYAEFQKTNPRTIEAAIARATRALAPHIFGAQLDDAIGLLAAHRLKLMTMGTTTAPAEEKSQNGDDDYGLTNYGRELRTMIYACAGAFPGGTWGTGGC